MFPFSNLKLFIMMCAPIVNVPSLSLVFISIDEVDDLAIHHKGILVDKSFWKLDGWLTLKHCLGSFLNVDDGR